MPTFRTIALACLCASFWTTPPAHALCLESGEYEQAIADMDAREVARTEAEAAQTQAAQIPPAGEARASEIAAAGDTKSGAN